MTHEFLFLTEQQFNALSTHERLVYLEAALLHLRRLTELEVARRQQQLNDAPPEEHKPPHDDEPRPD